MNIIQSDSTKEYSSRKEDAKNLFLKEERDCQTKEKSEKNISASKVKIDKIIEEANKKFLEEERKSFLNIDEEFLELLHNFIEDQKKKEQQKRTLKNLFFCIVMLGFFVLLITPIILIFKINQFSQFTAIVLSISILAELITAIIVLPQIIAKYLFNRKKVEKSKIY